MRCSGPKQNNSNKKDNSRKPLSHLTCPPTPIHPTTQFFFSPVALPYSLDFIFCHFSAAHTFTPSPLIRSSHSLSLSLSPVNHHNYRRNFGRIYWRKSIGDFLGSIFFQYFKVRTLSLRFLYFAIVFTNLSNLSVICNLIWATFIIVMWLRKWVLIFVDLYEE